MTEECYPYMGQDGGLCSTTQCKNRSASFHMFKAAATTPWTPTARATAAGGAVLVAEIQRELMEHGPVEAGIELFQDFAAYSSGVYTLTVNGSCASLAVCNNCAISSSHACTYWYYWYYWYYESMATYIRLLFPCDQMVEGTRSRLLDGALTTRTAQARIIGRARTLTVPAGANLGIFEYAGGPMRLASSKK